MNQVREIKISLIGESKIGKTNFLKRLNNDYKLNNNYATTLGVNVVSIDLNGNQGKIRLNIWDCGGTYTGLADKYHINSEGSIIFKKTNNNNHKKYEKQLPNNIKKFYIENYNVENPNLSIEQYKRMLYDLFVTV